MPKSKHTWLVVRALDELDQICMLQEFVDMVVEQLDKPESRNREMKIELLLDAYQKTIEFHLVGLRDRLNDIRSALEPEVPATGLNYSPSNPKRSDSSDPSNCR